MRTISARKKVSTTATTYFKKNLMMIEVFRFTLISLPIFSFSLYISRKKNQLAEKKIYLYMTNLTLIPSTSPKNSTPAPCEARTFFKEFKKEAQKLIQTQPCLILVVDPGPAEEPTSSSTVVGSCNGGGQNQNLQSDSTTTSSSSPDAAQDQQQQQVIVQAVQKQIVRCAEVDRCCEAVRNVLKKLSPCVPQDFEWREKVTRLPVILVNTSAGVGKFRRATRLYNGSSAFVVESD